MGARDGLTGGDFGPRELAGKVALVGLGYWGPNLLRALVSRLPPDQVVAVDTAPDRLARVASSQPAMRVLSSLDDALADPTVEAVILATPVSTHAPLAMKCLAAGRHVLVEKPLAHRPADGLHLVAAARARGLVLMVGHTFLFSPRVERMRECIKEGALGRVQYVTSERMNLGLHQRDVGVIWDLAPHDFSILFHVLEEYPVRVQTSGRGVVHETIPDVAFINLTFASGIIASITLSWLSPRKIRNTLVVGDKKMLVYNDIDSDEPIKIYDKGVVMPDPNSFGEYQLIYRHGDVLAPHVPAIEPLAQEVDHFLAAIASETVYRSDGEFGLRVIETIDAAEQSWLEGGRSIDVRHHALPGQPLEIDLRTPTLRR